MQRQVPRLLLQSVPPRLQWWKKAVLHKKNGPLGEVEHSWFRRETQQRGALHVHGAIWIKPGTKRADVVVAEMPWTTYPKKKALVDELKKLVFTLQRHTCNPKYCLIEGNKPLKSCRFNFPAPLVNEVRLDNTGLRKLYRRREAENRYIVPYSWN